MNWENILIITALIAAIAYLIKTFRKKPKTKCGGDQCNCS
jgi:hypothetical protein